MSNTIKEFNIKAKKLFGQNFLQNIQILEKIAREFDIRGKNVLEIGPGYGALTSYLLDEKPTSLTLVELDRDMIEILNKRIEN
ncbi:MAG: rRNA adenine N-6-methyltransferase family protein, partial [Candidatus Gracilibacteria bacterium]|nr:rRNA adenine N-6-methyltransferase family protein [Candidatus Gracilibacteria bacterium]